MPERVIGIGWHKIHQCHRGGIERGGINEIVWIKQTRISRSLGHGVGIAAVPSRIGHPNLVIYEGISGIARVRIGVHTKPTGGEAT